MFLGARKNRKQAAYVAPEPGPAPVPEIETVTVTVEIYPGAANGEVSAAEVATKLGVADLAAAIADGSVTYVGLNADGTVYTLEDGSTPAYSTNGPVGHWYNSEHNPISWGTPDPNGTGAVRCAFLEGDGVTYTLGYDNSSSFVAGETHTLAGKYIYGDVEVKFEVVINVVEAPASSFVAPDADYLINVQVVQDNAWGATWIALDGTEFGYWGAYSDPTKYVTPIADYSVDITSEIEAALGLGEGELEEALNAGDADMGAYNAQNEFVSCYEARSSNYFYWFAEEGSAEPSFGGMSCIDNIGFHENVAQLYGTCCLMPNSAVVGTTYPTYIVFRSGDAEYVVKVNQEAVAAPEKVALPEFEVVKTYEMTYEGTNPGAYTTPDPQFTLEEIMPDIQELIGGEPDMLLMGALDDNLELFFQEWSETDGWFGAEAAAYWGSESVMFCLKPNADGTFFYCGAINDGAVSAKCTYRYANSATVKAVDVVVSVQLTAATE